MRTIVQSSLAFSVLAVAALSVSCDKKDETKDFAGTLGNCKQTFKTVAPGSGLCTDWVYAGKLEKDPVADILPSAKSSCVTDTTYTAQWTDSKSCDTSAARAKCAMVFSATEGKESFTYTGTIYLNGEIYAEPAAYELVRAACKSNASANMTATWTEIKAPLAALTLDGTWNSGCVVDEGVYEKTTLVFVGSSYTSTTQYFATDNTCAAGSLTHSMTVTGTAWAEGEVTTPAGYRKLSYLYSDITVTPATDAATQQLNASSLYTFADWQTGTAKSIAGRAPSTTSTAKDIAPSIGSVGYDIVKVDNNTLTLGQNTDQLDGTSEAKRPTAASTAGFTKQ